MRISIQPFSHKPTACGSTLTSHIVAPRWRFELFYTRCDVSGCTDTLCFRACLHSSSPNGLKFLCVDFLCVVFPLPKVRKLMEVDEPIVQKK